MRRGTTIIELLVAVGIISLLAALLLPAVQRARETARRAECANHLKQLGTACEAFVGATGRYPHYLHFHTPRNMSGHVELLPHLDQGEVFNRIDQDEQGLAAVEPVTSSHNPDIQSHPVPVFVCPSDSVPLGGNSYRACFGTTTYIHATWAIGRPRPADMFRESLWGVFCGGRKARDIRDGLSNTALYSERLVGDRDSGTYRPWQDVAVLTSDEFHALLPDEAAEMCRRVPADSRHFSSSGVTWLFGVYAQTTYNHVLTPNSPTPDCVNAEVLRRSLGQGPHTARSYHPGGVNVCLADGSVRFVSENIDLRTWRALATIYGGEVISEF